MGTFIAEKIRKESFYPIEKVIYISPMLVKMPISPFNIPLVGECLTSIFIYKALDNIFKRNFLYNNDYYKIYEIMYRIVGFKESWLSVYRNIIGKEFLNLDNNSNTLILIGDMDKIFNLTYYKILKGLNIKIIKNAGHAIHVDQADVVNCLIANFLNN